MSHPPTRSGRTPDANLTGPVFLPWLRLGLAAQIDERAVDGLAPHDRATASVSLVLRSTGDGRQVEDLIPGPAVRLRGPADVVGIDPAQVLRCEPEPGALDAEPNYFVQVEFAAPDLPWRFTPAAPDGDRLQPWLALVVVADRAGVRLEDRGGQLRPALHVDAAHGELPDLRHCWAWAHVQADCDVSAGVARALADRPTAFRSRLLCPRRLTPDRAWLACVVPTFEAGRRAGLGEPTGANLGPAWQPASTNIRLPVYHWWRFRTGPRGDFESLVRRLVPRELPDTVGRRDLDVGEPGGGLPSAPGTRLTYAGALLSPSGTDRPWRPAHRTAMTAALRAKLDETLERNRPERPYEAVRDDPVIGPPAYAAPQAHRRTVPAEPDWFAELNTEPVERVVAALGSEVVRRDQEDLMAAAWRYAAEHREANRLLGTARLGWEIARIAEAKLSTLDDAALVQVAGPAMARLAAAGRTVRGLVAGTALPAGLISGAMRRTCRTVRGFAPVAAVTASALDDPVRFGAAWRTVRPPVGADLQATSEPGDRRAQPTSRTRIRASAPVASRMTPAAAGGATASTAAAGTPSTGTPSTGTPSTATAAIATHIRQALTPTATIAAMVRTRVSGLPTGGHDVPARIWARPRFTNPMYARLAALSPELLMPGAGAVPEDTLGLLVANQRFVEAFLAGLNHELGREFRWREYPARLDDTWSRRFWDTGTGANDIAGIRSWRGNRLGRHRPEGSAAPELVLLIKGALPRRYPDLRVYAVEAQWQDGKRREKPSGTVHEPVLTGALTPDMYVYGFTLKVAAAVGSTTPGADPGYFFVLEQRPEAIRFGLDVPKPHWCGTAPSSWRQLSWAHLAAQAEPLPDFADPYSPAWLLDAGELPGNGGRDAWGDDAAAMARITLQRPVRMLTHASAMLPEGSR